MKYPTRPCRIGMTEDLGDAREAARKAAKTFIEEQGLTDDSTDEEFDIALEIWHDLAGMSWNRALDDLGLSGEDGVDESVDRVLGG